MIHGSTVPRTRRREDGTGDSTRKGLGPLVLANEIGQLGKPLRCFNELALGVQDPSVVDL